MSEPDAVPLPREGEVFFDVRGEARCMRLSWYADSRVAVFSIWQGRRCTGTFRLPFADLARMVQTLQSGPRSRTQGPDGARRAQGPDSVGRTSRPDEGYGYSDRDALTGAPHAPDGPSARDSAPALARTSEHDRLGPPHGTGHGYPAEPAHLANPAYPASPAYPGEPAYPASPAYPGEPAYPASPAYSAEPARHEERAHPASPAHPAGPAYRADSALPDYRGDRALPGDPVDPGNLGYPGNPVSRGDPSLVRPAPPGGGYPDRLSDRDPYLTEPPYPEVPRHPQASSYPEPPRYPEASSYPEAPQHGQASFYREAQRYAEAEPYREAPPNQEAEPYWEAPPNGEAGPYREGRRFPDVAPYSDAPAYSDRPAYGEAARTSGSGDGYMPPYPADPGHDRPGYDLADQGDVPRHMDAEPVGSIYTSTHRSQDRLSAPYPGAEEQPSDANMPSFPSVPARTGPVSSDWDVATASYHGR